MNFVLGKFKNNENHTKTTGNKYRIIAALFTAIAYVPLVMFAGYLVEYIQKIIYRVDDNWLFCVQNTASIVLLMFLFLPLFLTIVQSILKRGDEEIDEDMRFLLIKKKKIYAVVLIFIFYIVITSVTFVTDNKIEYHSPLRPQGITYSYSDVTEVKTGFSSAYLFKGDFYYKACFNGKWINLSNTSINDKVNKYEDSYMELEDLDKRLMAYKPEKQSSFKHLNTDDYEQVYIDRLTEIIENK